MGYVAHNCNNKKLFFDTKNNVILTEFFDGHGYQGTDQELKDVAKNIAILHKVLADYPNCFNYKTNSQFYKILKLDDLSRLTKILSEKNLLDNFDKNVKKNLKKDATAKPQSALLIIYGMN